MSGAPVASSQRAPIISNNRRENKPVPVPASRPMPSSNPRTSNNRQPPIASAAAAGGGGAGSGGFMDEDAINAAAIAAALDEDEGLALAEKLQTEAYTSGNMSARGNSGAGAAASLSQ